MLNSTAKKFNIWFYAGIFALVCFLFSLFALLKTSYPSHYNLLPLIPLACAIMLFVGYIKVSEEKTNLVVLLIIATSLVRFCLLPALLPISNFATAMKINISQNASGAIFLMVYEVIAIFLTVIIVQSKVKYNKEFTQKVSGAVRLKMLGFILLILVAFCLFVVIYIPETKYLFKTIFDLTNEDFTTVTYSAAMSEVGSFKRILQTLFGMVFHFLRIMIPIFVIKFVRSKNIGEGITFCISFVFVALQFFFITSTFAESIISGLVILIVTAKLCQHRGKNLLKISAIFVIAIIVIYFIVRFWVNTTKSNTSYYSKSGDFTSYITNVINAYFTGVDNVAAVFNVSTTDKWGYLFFNVYRAIPFNTTLFGLEGDGFQTIYNTSNNMMGQIPPTIASGYYFFGPLLAPLFSVLITWVALVFANKAQRTEYFWEYVAYIFTGIAISLGLSMYSDAIVLHWFTNWELPIIILSKFSVDKIETAKVNK